MNAMGGAVNEPQSPRADAQYIATLTSQLAQIARRQRMDVLAYILDMAHIEAEQLGKGPFEADERPLSPDESWR
jgi:hypothetical protein